ncbi:hypothetical protein CRG98_011067 [Punica granatum]|uniref:Uncharacterized protein n=1 Tax=Punica granatum TaxID=22663 RepID=A0A2I0KJ38_PUNGR|nr:hypothetical protein CRG98_011067 [Punica granatum]
MARVISYAHHVLWHLTSAGVGGGRLRAMTAGRRLAFGRPCAIGSPTAGGDRRLSLSKMHLDPFEEGDGSAVGATRSAPPLGGLTASVGSSRRGRLVRQRPGEGAHTADPLPC